jgi:hypothetical protein
MNCTIFGDWTAVICTEPSERLKATVLVAISIASIVTVVVIDPPAPPPGGWPPDARY